MKRFAWAFVLAACGQEGPIGPEGVPGPEGAQGAAGPQGMPGADGQLRVYGNGSAGALTVAAGEPYVFLYDDIVTDGNLQFTDVTIDAGATFVVPSGTVIRCTGTFTNNGTVLTSFGASGGVVRTGTNNGMPAIIAPHPGNSARAAGTGAFGDNSESRPGGSPGGGWGTAARGMLSPGMFGGGGGGGVPWGAVGTGGGALVVRAATAIVNNGTISANGFVGANAGQGGGGGGIVILASAGAITSAMVTATGGAGGTGGGVEGHGGGGGGGVIHFLAPTIVAGTTNVAGGASGGTGGSVLTGARIGGGGGGGGVGGDGGAGSAVFANGTRGAATDGTPGRVFQTLADPTALF